MSKKQKFSLFIACDEAMHCCDKAQYKESSFIEKIKLSIHLLSCSACRKYTSNNIKLTNIMKKEEVQTFDSSEKSELDKLFQEQLKNSQTNNS